MTEQDEAGIATAQDESTPTVDGAGFAALGLSPELVATLSGLGYEEPTPIQEQAIPALLEGRDVLGQAATGTGKTAAFALPLIEKIAGTERQRASTSALVLVPTRELAMQVAEAAHKYGRSRGVTVLPIYGGQSMEQQLRALKRGVDVVVATPGRAHDHIRRRTLKLEHVRFVVLDEADEMLDMGFAEDLEAILGATPAERQTALFSATLPPRIAELAVTHLREPLRIQIARKALAAGEMPKVRHVAYVVPRAHKLTALGRVLDVEAPESAIVFCRTRHEVDELTESLNGRGYRAESLHGGMSQEQRDRVMKKFRSGNAELLIATDVAARGLDIPQLSHVVNYDVPSAPETYVHRVGRTGRAGREGVAISLIEPREHRLLRNIEHVTKQKITVESVPTVADLRARRLELTRASLEEVLTEGDFDHFRVAVESLANEYDVMDVAAAAMKLAHKAVAADGDEVEIPSVAPRVEREGGFDRKGGKPSRAERTRDKAYARGERPDLEERPARGAERRVKEKEHRIPRKRGGDMARVFVGAGRKLKVRPADLVGAIIGEAGLDARAIGAIEISDRFSIVEVPSDEADRVIDALKKTTIRGKTVTIRRDSKNGE
ncbi:MAG: DEAD/DEAH box helicase [Gemmatimonadaceae bacterium]|nr:DEAD/DEAH box helicase [Gemmatimonadaceae bacterium]NUQ92563.1 DEAD/DEAH box helicase [Gemmatimonadaceae bacterium]NUR18788.1 DEAD/DEAH box helicase [Gemmatimonadaceae bacterium]NUS97389.1 DEAD/DEAH box helicase [Gemmatimonadaceae bacterium]